jgi:hypothetical protein
MEPQLVSLVSACTALVASVAGPLAMLRVSRRQFDATVLSSSRQRWIDQLRDLLAELMSQLAGLSVLKTRWTTEWDRGVGLLRADPTLVAKLERLVLVRWKVRLMLGLPTDELLQHGGPRLVYGVDLAHNTREYLLGRDRRPRYILDGKDPPATSVRIARWWAQRWLLPRIEREETIERVASHTLIHPIRHGARVALPPEFDDEDGLFT